MEKHQGYFCFTGLILSAISYSYGGGSVALVVLFFQGLWFLHISKEKIENLQHELHKAELVIRQLSSGNSEVAKEYEFKSILKYE